MNTSIANNVSTKRTKSIVKTGWAKRMVHKIFSSIDDGVLTLQDEEDSYIFGNESKGNPLRAHITVHDMKTYAAILQSGTVGAGESYMQGMWESSDIVATVQIFTRNFQTMDAMDSQSPIRTWFSNVVQSLYSRNTLTQAKRNIVAHYDLSNAFFERFLDESMMYSSAIFPHCEASLEEASENKLRHICERLQLDSSDHLIEIGSGWGALACYAASHYGCKVTTTTISDEQYELAQQRVVREGLEDYVTLLKQDYRTLKGEFDKLVSVEMVEAVGYEYYEEYFSTCNRLLKNDGLMLIQSITIADQRFEESKKFVDFIKKYIFPGGCLPSLASISANVAKDTNMQIVGVEDITPHYAETLRHWRQRFHAEIEAIHALGFNEQFCKMWDFYLAYCEGGFRERVVSTVQVLAAKPGCRVIPDVGSI